MFGFIIILIYFVYIFFLIRTIIKRAVQKRDTQGATQEMKKDIKEFADEFKGIFDVFMDKPNTEELSSSQEKVYLKEPVYQMSIEDIKHQEELIEAQEEYDDLFNGLEDDDIILEVDHSLSQGNIRDIRSVVSRSEIRKGIIISEILNKPKTMRN